MKKEIILFLLILGLLITTTIVIANGNYPPTYLLRGDVDNNDRIDLTDAISLLDYLFKGGTPPELLPSVVSLEEMARYESGDSTYETSTDDYSSLLEETRYLDANENNYIDIDDFAGGIRKLYSSGYRYSTRVGLINGDIWFLRMNENNRPATHPDIVGECPDVTDNGLSCYRKSTIDWYLVLELNEQITVEDVELIQSRKDINKEANVKETNFQRFDTPMHGGITDADNLIKIFREAAYLWSRQGCIDYTESRDYYKCAVREYIDIKGNKELCDGSELGCDFWGELDDYPCRTICNDFIIGYSNNDYQRNVLRLELSCNTETDFNTHTFTCDRKLHS